VNVAVLVGGLLLVLPLVAVLGIGFKFDPHEIASPLIQKAAPDFTLTPLDGSAPVTLSAQRGHPVVVNFWATWCIPCQAEHRDLQALARMFAGKVSFYGVVYQDKPEAIASWLEKRGSLFPQLVDTGSSAALAFGVYGVPETYVIDKEGIIVHKVTGPIDGGEMQSLLSMLVAK